MKMTGTLLKPASALQRRQDPKPSICLHHGVEQDDVGVIWSTMRIAAAPSSATITVMPRRPARR